MNECNKRNYLCEDQASEKENHPIVYWDVDAVNKPIA